MTDKSQAVNVKSFVLGDRYWVRILINEIPDPTRPRDLWDCGAVVRDVQTGKKIRHINEVVEPFRSDIIRRVWGTEAAARMRYYTERWCEIRRLIREYL